MSSRISRCSNRVGQSAERKTHPRRPDRGPGRPQRPATGPPGPISGSSFRPSSALLGTAIRSRRASISMASPRTHRLDRLGRWRALRSCSARKRARCTATRASTLKLPRKADRRGLRPYSPAVGSDHLHGMEAHRRFWVPVKERHPACAASSDRSGRHPLAQCEIFAASSGLAQASEKFLGPPTFEVRNAGWTMMFAPARDTVGAITC